MNSLLYFHNPFSVTSPDCIASTAHFPIIVPATNAGPIPPASSGFGIQAESPTITYPFATIQSFCLLTETWKLPVTLFLSSGSVESLGFFIALFLSTYSLIRVETLSFFPNLLFLFSKSVFSIPNPMLTLFSPLGKTHA